MSPQENQKEFGSLLEALRVSLQEQSPSTLVQGSEIANLLASLDRLKGQMIEEQRRWQRKTWELEQLNVRKDHILESVVHDFRSPLSVVLTCTEFLLEEASHNLGSEKRESLGIIHSSTEFMLRLVEELLDFTSFRSDHVQLACEPCDVAELVEKNIIMNRILAEREGKVVRLHLGREIPTIQVDAVKIERVLNNLIANAIAYSSPGDVIDIEADADEDGILIAVKDEGQGISVEELAKLFEADGRISYRNGEGKKRPGLGLLIAKRIVDAHGGKIWAERRPDRGTAFYLWLPASLPTTNEALIIKRNTQA